MAAIFISKRIKKENNSKNMTDGGGGMTVNQVMIKVDK